jgi:hypothetical protein
LACFIRYPCHASDHNKNWTQENLIYQQNTFFVVSGKITKNSYKIIGSFFQFFDCKIIANKKGVIEPLNKNLMWRATLINMIFPQMPKTILGPIVNNQL